MPRLLVNGNWHEVLGSSALYESEYENVIVQNSSYFFPDFRMIRFRSLLESPFGASKPDYVLIHKEYKAWFLVEVEMAHHDFEYHVLPQAINLYNAIIDSNHADSILEEDNSLDAIKLKDLLVKNAPPVLVIVNRPVPQWEKDLGRWGIHVCIVELFRSSRNSTAFLISGYIPEINPEFITYCSLDNSLPRHLLIHNPASLPISNGQTINLIADAGIAEWTRIDVKDTTWLRCNRPVILPRNYDFKIDKVSGNRFSLTVVDKNKHRRLR